jgi:hypothetical protein
MKNLDADAKVILTNAIGQVVYETQTAKSQFTIDMSNFATGLYIMQVKTANGESVQRVIKK